MDYSKLALELHEEKRGKISISSKVELNDKDDLSIAYTPGVAEPCRKIAEKKDEVYKYTSKGNLVAIVSDGTAVLGLGDIGPEAALPVMEGKAVLFKKFADVDAFPMCIETKDVDEIVDLVKKIAPTFGGINLEDISAPRCIEIEERLKKELDIPVFHDDQHGTAIVVVAGLVNALKVVKKEWKDVRVVINGPGAAGSAITKMVLNMGAKDILVCGKEGILHRGDETHDVLRTSLAEMTNIHNVKGDLALALSGADVFIGVSAPDVVTKEMITSMNSGAVVFAMANPIPEIMPDLAKEAGAVVVGSGRSDFANQVNNVLAFPGIFRGALDVRASDINEEMKIAAALAIADIISEVELSSEYIIPNPLDPRVVERVSKAVAKAARETGVARI
ncbi:MULTISPECIES: NADP-dependent malic enzyme [unclassified Fusibacter]|uniref:NAD(P)-dependent malic enzyme n=1 Tax=unclassified Fusibacter TaxID=2624464 RepID=UPI00101246F8|nr:MULTISPECIES: malic enzyme-like NAD(P)-binding protein [unclassified Fusibacter]MCK8059162.1 NAD-dependent malic enzyme [Fusibacter sp. A2]NPE22571.1 NAD-dependent malic enzyme [Fusibacter sp. A1]RXV60673.1 NAD-dependent malic enzyme [Fusibacter sp. A1]